MRTKPVVAIDGPAGSGKSTIAKQLAKRLGFIHIDTGAIYRGVAWLAMQKNIDLHVEKAVAATAAQAKFEFRATNDGNHFFVDGKDVSGEIRTEEVSAAASKVSAYPSVRALLLGLQRGLGINGAAVLEGRDIGTVVFPDAEVKIFLTASVEERARRRHEELQAKGAVLSLEEVKHQVVQRDEQDSNRPVAPLKKAADAILLDTTGLAITSVLDQLESLVRDA